MRSAPERQGVDPAAIVRLVETLEARRLETHSLMIVRHGSVLAETWWKPYRSDEPHLLYSLTKSFTSTAVGFAVAEGLFGLDDLLVDCFADLTPVEPHPNLSAVKVRHLLSMSVGHDVEPSIDPFTSWRDYTRRFLDHPVPHEPGEHFHYNTPASHMLSILVQARSGQPLDVFLKSRLLDPLGVGALEWTRGADFTWGGSGLFADTETIAKFGLLYLNQGKWEGEQVLPVGWSDMASRRHVSNGSDPNNDWNQGYGFQFWRCRHGAFRGDGAYGQFCIVLPEQDAVVAITSGDCPLQEVLDAVWEQLLPGFDSGAPASLDLAPSLMNRVLEPREPSSHGRGSLNMVSAEENFELLLADGSGFLSWNGRVSLRVDEWIDGQFGFNRYPERPVSARVAWLGHDELLVKIVDRHRPHRIQFRLVFVGEDATVFLTENGDFSAIAPRSFGANAQ